MGICQGSVLPKRLGLVELDARPSRGKPHTASCCWLQYTETSLEASLGQQMVDCLDGIWLFLTKQDWKPNNQLMLKHLPLIRLGAHIRLIQP